MLATLMLPTPPLLLPALGGVFVGRVVEQVVDRGLREYPPELVEELLALLGRHDDSPCEGRLRLSQSATSTTS